MGVDAQAQENKNARLDKQFDKVKVFDGSKPSECHPWLEEVHALCIQTGRPFHGMLLLCAGQAVRDFIRTCLLMQLMIRSGMTSSLGTRIYKG